MATKWSLLMKLVPLTLTTNRSTHVDSYHSRAVGSFHVVRMVFRPFIKWSPIRESRRLGSYQGIPFYANILFVSISGTKTNKNKLAITHIDAWNDRIWTLKQFNVHNPQPLPGDRRISFSVNYAVVECETVWKKLFNPFPVAIKCPSTLKPSLSVVYFTALAVKVL